MIYYTSSDTLYPGRARADFIRTRDWEARVPFLCDGVNATEPQVAHREAGRPARRGLQKDQPQHARRIRAMTPTELKPTLLPGRCAHAWPVRVNGL